MSKSSFKNQVALKMNKVNKVNKRMLDNLYERYNRRDSVHPDPLEFLYAYPNLEDREIVGLLASSLAYGNVGQILKSVSLILGPLGKSPRLFVEKTSHVKIKKIYSKFKHRWHTGDDIASLLLGVQSVLQKYGSLQACLKLKYRDEDSTILTAASFFVQEISRAAKGMRGNLLPSPVDGSACKRLSMYLRWMIRRDAVDPGGWDEISPSKLLIPLDTHMFRVGRLLRMTRSRQANMKTVVEMTAHFSRIVPEDPVRYDFVLTRAGIWKDKKLFSELVNLRGQDKIPL